MKRIEHYDIDYALGSVAAAMATMEAGVRDCYAIYNDPEALEKVNRTYSILKELEEYLQEQELN